MVASPDNDPVFCSALESLDDGRLIVAGIAGENGYVSRLLANGTPDPAFVADPTIALSMNEATSVATTGDGKVLVAGSGSEGVSIVRLQANGEPDASFGDGGRTWIELESEWGSTPIVHDMHITDDGEVIAGGGDVSTDQPFVVRLLGDSGGVSHGVVGFSENNIAEPQESSGQAVVRVRRTGGRDGDVSVTYRTVADANAAAEQDFTAASGTLQWADGDSSDREIVLGIHEDNGSPGVFRVVSCHAREQWGRRGVLTRNAQVTIQPDGEPAGQIEFADSTSWTSGEGGIAQIALYRNYYSEGAVCVTVTPTAGTANAGEDFIADPSTVCWDDKDADWKRGRGAADRRRCRGRR